MSTHRTSQAAARDEMMRRLRTAVRNPLLAADRQMPWVPAALPATPTADELLADWRREFQALAGHVYGPMNAAAARDQLVTLLRARSLGRVLTWNDRALPVPALQPSLAAAGIEAIIHPPDWKTLSLAEADTYAAGVTGTIAGLADTGSILVASGPDRARSASLVPPVLFALLRVGDIYPSLAAWLRLAGSETLRTAANVVIVTGPSRTADIELNLVIGVHGPGEIHVMLVDDHERT